MLRRLKPFDCKELLYYDYQPLSAEAEKEIALVGDSKAFQWLPALDTWARENGYRVRSNIKSACSFSAAL